MLISRAFAFLLDCLILWAICILALTIWYFADLPAGLWSGVAWAVLALSYFVLTEGLRGASIGKYVAGLTIQTADGRPAWLHDALLRSSVVVIGPAVFTVIHGFSLGYAPLPFRLERVLSEGQGIFSALLIPLSVVVTGGTSGIQDLISRTIVVKHSDPRRPTFRRSLLSISALPLALAASVIPGAVFVAGFSNQVEMIQAGPSTQDLAAMALIEDAAAWRIEALDPEYTDSDGVLVLPGVTRVYFSAEGSQVEVRPLKLCVAVNRIGLLSDAFGRQILEIAAMRISSSVSDLEALEIQVVRVYSKPFGPILFSGRRLTEGAWQTDENGESIFAVDEDNDTGEFGFGFRSPDDRFQSAGLAC